MKGASAMKADLVSDQQRLEAESDAIIGETERLILMLRPAASCSAACWRCCWAGEFPGR